VTVTKVSEIFIVIIIIAHYLKPIMGFHFLWWKDVWGFEPKSHRYSDTTGPFVSFSNFTRHKAKTDIWCLILIISIFKICLFTCMFMRRCKLNSLLLYKVVFVIKLSTSDIAFLALWLVPVIVSSSATYHLYFDTYWSPIQK